MMSIQKLIGLAAALALVLGVSGQAGAATTSLDTTAAAIVAPVITGTGGLGTGTARTLVTVTNAGGPVRLHVNVISGDGGNDNWLAQNFDCPVTANETVLFTFTGIGATGTSSLSYECNNANPLIPGVVTTTLLTRNGIMFVSIEDPATGLTLNSDQIFADWVVIDAGEAFSAGAIAFQGGVPGGGTPDRKYRFDGVEYTEFPSALATNFLAPGGANTAAAFLVLFTLDGTAGISGLPAGNIGPPVALDIKFYDDDEIQYSTGYSFNCFSIVSLLAIDPRFAAGAGGLNSQAGHMTMTPQLVVYPDRAHDAQYDGGGVLEVRKTPAHGWLVQRVGVGPGTGAFARTLAQSQLPLEPHTGDTVVYGGR
jgi:hypothetical protein